MSKKKNDKGKYLCWISQLEVWRNKVKNYLKENNIDLNSQNKSMILLYLNLYRENRVISNKTDTAYINEVIQEIKSEYNI